MTHTTATQSRIVLVLLFSLLALSRTCWSRPAVPPGAKAFTNSESQPVTGNPAIVQAPGDQSLRDTLVIMVYLIADEGIDSQKHYIEPLPPRPEITVTSPDAGAVWPLGSKQRIRWTASAVEQVYIELSYDNGKTYEKRIVEAGKTINLGDPEWLDYAWTVEGETGDNCIIRVSEYENKAYGVAGPFSIVNQSEAAAKQLCRYESSPRITFPADSGERLLPGDAYMFRGTGANPAWYYRVVDTLESETSVRFTRDSRRATPFSAAGLSRYPTAGRRMALYTLSGRRIQHRQLDPSLSGLRDLPRIGLKSAGPFLMIMTGESAPQGSPHLRIKP